MSKCPHCGSDLTTGGCVNPSCGNNPLGKSISFGTYFPKNNTDDEKSIIILKEISGKMSRMIDQLDQILYELRKGK